MLFPLQPPSRRRAMRSGGRSSAAFSKLNDGFYSVGRGSLSPVAWGGGGQVSPPHSFATEVSLLASLLPSEKQQGPATWAVEIKMSVTVSTAVMGKAGLEVCA